jgi:hypothetical protein
VFTLTQGETDLATGFERDALKGVETARLCNLSGSIIMLSIKHSFLFIHRGKTGGNSIAEALLPYSDDAKVVTSSQDGVERFDVENTTFGTRKHFTLRQYADVLPPDLFARIYKFSTLRNPFDRLVSAYFSPHRVANGKISGFNREQFKDLILNQKTMRDFICLSPDSIFTGDIQFLMRFEQLEHDLKHVTRELGLGEVTLNHRNRSDRRPYQAYYDVELRALAEDRFREELEYGGYSF